MARDGITGAERSQELGDQAAHLSLGRTVEHKHLKGATGIRSGIIIYPNCQGFLCVHAVMH